VGADKEANVTTLISIDPNIRVRGNGTYAVPDIADQVQQFVPAVAGGLGWWEGSGHGGGFSHEPLV
jgi:hypothetical protein